MSPGSRFNFSESYIHQLWWNLKVRPKKCEISEAKWTEPAEGKTHCHKNCWQFSHCFSCITTWKMWWSSQNYESIIVLLVYFSEWNETSPMHSECRDFDASNGWGPQDLVHWTSIRIQHKCFDWSISRAKVNVQYFKHKRNAKWFV